MKTLSQRLAETHAQAVADTKGPAVVEPGGALAIPPTTGELMMWFKTYQQQAEATIATLNTTIAQLQTVLNGKASADSLATVRQNLTTLTSTVAGKANAVDVEQQFAANYELDTTQTAAIKAAQDLLATDGGLLQNLMAAQTQLGNVVTGLRTDVDLKAPASTVSTLTGQVTTLRNTVNDGSTGLATKASAADLTTTNSNVAANTSAIALRATTAALNTQAGRIDGLVTTTVPALQTDISSRLLRTGDTASGPIVVPTATNKTAAPRFEQVFGGINSPRRTMENLTTGTSELLPLTDTTGQNRKILPINVLFLLTGNQPAGAVTVKLGTTSGGAELYTKTYSLLTGLLGKVLAPDLPASATPLPAGQRLFVTITGGGLWTCFFDAVFLPTAS